MQISSSFLASKASFGRHFKVTMRDYNKNWMNLSSVYFLLENKNPNFFGKHQCTNPSEKPPEAGEFVCFDKQDTVILQDFRAKFKQLCLNSGWDEKSANQEVRALRFTPVQGSKPILSLGDFQAVKQDILKRHSFNTGGIDFVK